MAGFRFARPGILIRRLGAFVLVAGLSLLLLEWMVRLLLPVHDPSGRISFVLENGFPLGPPNFEGRLWRNTGDYDVSISINGYGFRDRKDLAASSPGDLFVVGDSFSFGWGVEEQDRYSDRVGDLLGMPVFNIAIPTDFDGYARLLGHARENGAVVERLIIGVCMENDLQYYLSLPERYEDPASGNPRFSRVRLKNFLTKHSALYGAVTTTVHQNPTLRGFADRFGWITESVDGMVRNRYVPEIIENSADRLVRLIDESGVEEYLVLIIPSRGLWQGGNEAVELRVHEEFTAALAGRGLVVIDMKPLFEKGADPLFFHFQSDGHWNEAGHALAAEAIRDYCRGRGLFGQGGP